MYFFFKIYFLLNYGINVHLVVHAGTMEARKGYGSLGGRVARELPDKDSGNGTQALPQGQYMLLTTEASLQSPFPMHIHFLIHLSIYMSVCLCI